MKLDDLPLVPTLPELVETECKEVSGLDLLGLRSAAESVASTQLNGVTTVITCSMSRKGDCYDNAVMERFFCSLKGEWTNHETYADLPAARISVFKYIETFYNSKRIHQTLGYKTPNDFEDAFDQMNQTHTDNSKADHAPTCSMNQVA